MKAKRLAWIYIVLLSMGTILSLYMPKNEVAATNSVVIPDEAIRLRILANSDSKEDQAIKQLVRDEVNEEISKWVEDLTSVEAARDIIQSRLPQIQKIAENVLMKENINQKIQVDFGKVDFPTKLYGEFLYPAGQYEAILITIGEGNGANWWCVLFPPLCFLDFSNGLAVKEQTEDKKRKPDANGEKREEKSEEGKGNDSEEESVKKEKEKESEKDKEEQEEETSGEKENNLYVDEDEEPVEVKFFILEIFDGLFN